MIFQSFWLVISPVDTPKPHWPCVVPPKRSWWCPLQKSGCVWDSLGDNPIPSTIAGHYLPNISQPYFFKKIQVQFQGILLGSQLSWSKVGRAKSSARPGPDRFETLVAPTPMIRCATGTRSAGARHGSPARLLKWEEWCGECYMDFYRRGASLKMLILGSHQFVGFIYDCNVVGRQPEVVTWGRIPSFG